MKLIKKQEVLGIIAKSNSSLYSDIKLGLMTPSVSIGENSVAWPYHECEAINAARMAGKSNDEIKQFVLDLVDLRKVIAGKDEAQIRIIVAKLFKGRATMNSKHINKIINVIATGDSVTEFPENQRKKIVKNLLKIRNNFHAPEFKYQQIINLINSLF